MTVEFVRKRITELRLRKNVSEYQMSYDLGKSRSFVYNISSGRSVPPLKELFAIIDYFDISVAEFFNEQTQHSDLELKILGMVGALSEADMDALLPIVGQMHLKNEVINDLNRGIETLQEKTIDV